MTPKQKKFADGYIDTGNATEAAVMAYRPKKRATARSIGSENLTKPDIKAYLAEKTGDAAAMVYKLAMDGKAETIRLRASQDILDRAGYKATDKLLTLNTETIEKKINDDPTLADEVAAAVSEALRRRNIEANREE